MPTSRFRRSRGEAGRLGAAGLFFLAALVVIAGVGVAIWRGAGPLPDPEGCTAVVGDVTVDLSTEQAENAAIIAAVGMRRGLPARAVSIALATAYQESKIQNLGHGDRDSLGLFQQRPSQGWGTARQIENPYYSANRFYDELVKVHGYQTMRITEAAQQVQRSGYPDAYSAHAEDARALASALTGYSPAEFSCVVRNATAAAAPRSGSRAREVRRDLRHAFGAIPVRVHDREVDVRVGGHVHGWAIAHYLVAQADRLGVIEVAYDHRVWKAGDASQRGWRRESDAGSGRVRVQLAG